MPCEESDDGADQGLPLPVNQYTSYDFAKRRFSDLGFQTLHLPSATSVPRAKLGIWLDAEDNLIYEDEKPPRWDMVEALFDRLVKLIETTMKIDPKTSGVWVGSRRILQKKGVPKRILVSVFLYTKW